MDQRTMGHHCRQSRFPVYCGLGHKHRTLSVGTSHTLTIYLFAPLMKINRIAALHAMVSPYTPAIEEDPMSKQDWLPATWQKPISGKLVKHLWLTKEMMGHFDGQQRCSLSLLRERTPCPGG
jgi:hypothetical protein